MIIYQIQILKLLKELKKNTEGNCSNDFALVKYPNCVAEKYFPIITLYKFLKIVSNMEVKETL